MGCDIHGTLEILRYKTLGWEFTALVPGTRTYDWFGVLAGVRNYVNAIPISELRGIPDKLSEKTSEDIAYWDGDGHSHSWLTHKDFTDYDWTQQFVDGRGGETLTARDLIRDEWRTFLEYMKGLADIYGAEKVRIIFWFDN